MGPSGDQDQICMSYWECQYLLEQMTLTAEERELVTECIVFSVRETPSPIISFLERHW